MSIIDISPNAISFIYFFRLFNLILIEFKRLFKIIFVTYITFISKRNYQSWYTVYIFEAFKIHYLRRHVARAYIFGRYQLFLGSDRTHQ